MSKSQLRSPKTQVLAILIVASLGISSCGKGSNKNVLIDGVDGPRVNFVDNKLTMSVILKQVTIDFGLRIQIPKLPNSYVEVGPDFQSAGYMISVGIDANDLKALTHDGFNTLDPTSLPGGRPLPGVVEGQMPGLAVEIPKWHNLAFYFGADVFGTFVPVKLPIKDVIGTFRFYDGAGDRIGNISVVGKDANDKNSGFLLLVNLHGKVGQLIQL
ncbi:MAG: hypothetical protein AABZ55_01440 [Bdellovibrionota bacterium]